MKPSYTFTPLKDEPDEHSLKFQAYNLDERITRLRGTSQAHGRIGGQDQGVGRLIEQEIGRALVYLLPDSNVQCIVGLSLFVPDPAYDQPARVKRQRRKEK